MPTLTLTVAKVDPPRPNGGKKSKIVGVGGETIYAYPDKAAKFTPGHSYEVDYSTSEYNNKTFNNLESFHEVEGAPPPAASHAPQAAAFRTPEQMFVSDILVAYIANGRCEPQKLTETINYVRMAWNKTFGGKDGVFTASEAGQRYHMEAAE